MIVLDTDHLSVLKYHDSPLCRQLLQRMDQSPDQDFRATIVSVEEQMRGWLALVSLRSRSCRKCCC